MERHPEGGWYVQTFKDQAGGARGHSTAIYYLLERGEHSHWHRVRDAVEVWHFYAGAPLALSIAEDGKPATTVTLGSNILIGERPQAIVPANGGNRRPRSVPGRWSAAPSRPASISPPSRWHQPDWQPPEA